MLNYGLHLVAGPIAEPVSLAAAKAHLRVEPSPCSRRSAFPIQVLQPFELAMLSAGTLNRRVTIQSQTATQDVYGAPSQTWNDTLIVWASIHPATGREVYATQGFVAQLSHVITIRYTTIPIETNMRVLYGSRTFLIQGVSDPDEAHVQLNLLCLEST